MRIKNIHAMIPFVAEIESGSFVYFFADRENRELIPLQWVAPIAPKADDWAELTETVLAELDSQDATNLKAPVIPKHILKAARRGNAEIDALSKEIDPHAF